MERGIINTDFISY